MGRSTSRNRWIVVGGGFRGIIAAHYLAKGGCTVTIVERASFLGGIMYSRDWNGFYLDMGCHLFDNVDDQVTDVMLEIMDGEVFPISVRYASVTEGVKSDGIAVPDYTTLDRSIQEKILYEVIESAAAEPREPSNLADLLRLRYGETLGTRLSSAARKMFHFGPEQLEASASASTPFERIKIIPDSIALLLKEIRVLDERIAASSADDPLKFYRDKVTKYPNRNFYPRGKGMRSFCESAQAHLGRLGVEMEFEQSVESIDDDGTSLKLTLSSGRALEADRVFWGLDPGSLSQLMLNNNPLGELQHQVPMVLYFFECPIEQVGEYTYVHDFSEHTLIFRASTPGVYGKQVTTDGSTYVCFEVPTFISSPQWEAPEAFLDAVWQEAVSLDVVRGRRPPEYTVIRAPVTYKLPKRGFDDCLDEVMTRIKDSSEGIIVAGESAFSKVDIVASLEHMLVL